MKLLDYIEICMKPTKDFDVVKLAKQVAINQLAFYRKMMGIKNEDRPAQTAQFPTGPKP
jgi:hypothetical protein